MGLDSGGLGQFNHGITRCNLDMQGVPGVDVLSLAERHVVPATLLLYESQGLHLSWADLPLDCEARAAAWSDDEIPEGVCVMYV